MSLLDVSDLTTKFDTDEGTVTAVNDLDLSIGKNEILGVVGESGSGKSVTALSIIGLIDQPGYIESGAIKFKGENLRTASEDYQQEIRGNEISMIFQDPMSALNPMFTIGAQISEVLRKHQKIDEDISWFERSMLSSFLPTRKTKTKYPQSWERAVELLDDVGIADPEQRADDYPHQLSGGMQQRALIAQALTCEPSLLIADEPTTALDVTIQAKILSLIRELQQEHEMSVLLITHNLGVISEVCDRVAVMYAGEIVEKGTVNEILQSPKHPYTWALLRSVPEPDSSQQQLEVLEGQVPEGTEAPDACPFAPRCEYAEDVCYDHHPRMYSMDKSTNHQARCVLYDETNVYTPPEKGMHEENIHPSQGRGQE